jgi:hypothetical protein
VMSPLASSFLKMVFLMGAQSGCEVELCCLFCGSCIKVESLWGWAAKVLSVDGDRFRWRKGWL